MVAFDHGINQKQKHNEKITAQNGGGIAALHRNQLRRTSIWLRQKPSLTIT
jgi:hypothetical protein